MKRFMKFRFTNIKESYILTLDIYFAYPSYTGKSKTACPMQGKP